MEKIVLSIVHHIHLGRISNETSPSDCDLSNFLIYYYKQGNFTASNISQIHTSESVPNTLEEISSLIVPV